MLKLHRIVVINMALASTSAMKLESSQKAKKWRETAGDGGHMKVVLNPTAAETFYNL